MWFVLLSVLAAAAASDYNTIDIYGYSGQQYNNAISNPQYPQNLLSADFVLNYPVFIYASDSDDYTNMTVYYVPYGLSSTSKFSAFSKLHQYLKTPYLKSALFYPQSFYNPRFFDAWVKDYVFPENFKVVDSFRHVASTYKAPILYIAPEKHFNYYGFDTSSPSEYFHVYEDQVVAGRYNTTIKHSV